MRIASHSTVNGRSVNHALASGAAQQPVPEILTNRVRIQTPRDFYLACVRRVAEAHGVPIERLLERDKAKTTCVARNEAIIALMQEFPALSLEQVARIFSTSYNSIYVVLQRHRARTATDGVGNGSTTQEERA